MKTQREEKAFRRRRHHGWVQVLNPCCLCPNNDVFPPQGIGRNSHRPGGTRHCAWVPRSSLRGIPGAPDQNFVILLPASGKGTLPFPFMML